jgi:hypothetical protein
MIQDKQLQAGYRKKTVILLILIFVIFLTVISSGCIKLMQQSTGNASIQRPEVLHSDPVNAVATADPGSTSQRVPSPKPTPSVISTTSSLFSDAEPILPPDPYPIQHATQINETPLTNRHVRYAELSRTYVLRGNSTGLVVNATVLEGPLWICFDVEPLYDCLENVESCRGGVTKTISRPYFTLTVRNNRTREIVAEDGYGGEYSSQKTNRTIKIYEEGQYHLTLTGNSVDVTLAVATGAAPPVPNSQSSSAASQASTKTLSPEYLRYLEESGG